MYGESRGRYGEAGGSSSLTVLSTKPIGVLKSADATSILKQPISITHNGKYEITGVKFRKVSGNFAIVVGAVYADVLLTIPLTAPVMSLSELTSAGDFIYTPLMQAAANTERSENTLYLSFSTTSLDVGTVCDVEVYGILTT